MAHFSVPYFIPISPVYILISCIRIFNYFLFLADSLMPSVIIFSCDLWSLYSPVHFLSMWLCGIIAITNRNSESVSPWKITLGIFPSAKLSFSCGCQFHSPVFFWFLDKLYHLVGYLVHYQVVYYPALRDHIVFPFIINPRYSNNFPSPFPLFGGVLTNI